MLFFTTGLFTECVRGQYGTNCYLTCGHCSDTVTSCDRVTGKCKACQAGWKGEKCDQGKILRVLNTFYYL